MNQSFYIGAVGAQQQQSSLNVQGNNIARAQALRLRAYAGSEHVHAAQKPETFEF